MEFLIDCLIGLRIDLRIDFPIGLLSGLPLGPLIDFPIDIVDVFRNSRHLMDVVHEILPLGIGCLWTQLGVRDRAAEALAHRNGTTLVIDKCPAIETPKLMRAGLL